MAMGRGVASSRQRPDLALGMRSSTGERRSQVKRTLIGATVLVALLAGLRRFGPALGKRAMRKCEEMFDRMPEDFPPKRMMHSIEEVRAQNTRILRQIEEGRSLLGSPPVDRAPTSDGSPLVAVSSRTAETRKEV